MPSHPRPDPAFVDIHYLRPPDRRQVFRQEIVAADNEVVITFARSVDLPGPVLIGEKVALEKGGDAVWFTFPGLWHDIGRFHQADGTFTGIYANVLTPCEFEAGGIWRTTDLFLDLWIPADSGKLRLLDEAELREAEEHGWISTEMADRAREEATRLESAFHQGEWPPPVVHEWTRERVLTSLELDP